MVANCSYLFYFLHRRFYTDQRLSLNYYHILDVNSNTSSKEIKHAFYRLSKKYHPDVNTDDVNAASKFSVISNAYDILNNSIKRQEYDNQFSVLFRFRFSDGPDAHPAHPVNKSLNQLFSRSSISDAYVTYNRRSQYTQRARAYRTSARYTNYSINHFYVEFHRNTRNRNDESFKDDNDKNSNI